MLCMLRSMLCMLLSGGQGLNVVYAAQRGTGTEYSPKLPWIGVALADLFVINRPVSPGQLSHPTALRRYALEGQDRGRGACLCCAAFLCRNVNVSRSGHGHAGHHDDRTVTVVVGDNLTKKKT